MTSSASGLVLLVVVVMAARPASAGPAAAALSGGAPIPASLASIHFDDPVPAEPRLDICFVECAPAPRLDARGAVPQQAPVPVAFEYSDAYQMRNRIHRIASYATLPLFGAEAYIGQRMFNNPANATSGMRHLHGAIATSIVGLFAVNSVTGVWNLVEGRKDPHGGMLRVVHATLMLVADAGFVATALIRPNGRSARGAAIYDQKKNQHLTIAYASISVATIGYVIMLFR